jgi:threonine/homoserine/homoserine lactone efflux protein
MINLTAFLSYVFITTFTPGPNNLMSMYNAGTYGFKKSLFFNVGIFLGFTVVMALCSVFSLALYRYLPSIHPIMSVIGAIYILYLAWKIGRGKGSEAQGERNTTSSLSSGLFLQFVNPKVILYGVTLFATFILPYSKELPVLLAFAVLLAFIAFVSTCCWALFGSLFKEFLAIHYKAANTIMALLLVYCAISLFL